MALSGHLETALDALVRAPIPELADFCLVGLVESNQLRIAASAHADPGSDASLARLPRTIAFDSKSDSCAIARAIRTGRAVVEPDREEGGAHGLEIMLRALNGRSSIAVPLSGRDAVIGALVLGYASSGRRHREDDVVFASELGARVALAIENERLRATAQAAVTALDDLLAIMSRDLRAPLHDLDRAVAALLPLPVASERRAAERIVRNIQRSTDRLRQVVDDLLTATTLETGRFGVLMAIEEAEELVDEAAAFAELKAAARAIRIVRWTSPDLPTIFCDRDRIVQVLQILIGNALEAAPSESTVNVEASVLTGAVCFSVADQGRGVASELLPNVFERHPRTAGEARLGLFIAKGIVEAHGGRIWVETEIGRGATFYFTVPLA
jgi:signal transduction histidine kinase